MNELRNTLQAIGIPIIAFGLLMTLGGCSDSPTEAETPEYPDPPSAQELVATLDLEATELAGVDLDAISRVVNLEALELAQSGETALDAAASKSGGFTVVSPGESIQAAIDAAPDGALIRIRPGTYREALLITRPVALVGWPGHGGNRVVIENPGGEENGVTIRDTENVLLANFTVRGFEDNGVFAVGLNGYVMFRIHAIDNHEYGLFPVRSNNGIIAQSSATGSADSGIYVGQSENVLVTHNEAYGNVVGIEIENAVRICVVHNEAYENTAGMLAVLLPPSRFITFLETSDLFVAHNKFYENNLENFAEGGLVAAVPTGTGLLIVGYNETLVSHNLVRDNAFTGIGVGSTATFGAIAGIPITGIEPDPDNVRITHNLLEDNATGEPTLPGFPPADLLWDLTGSGNCWAKNQYDTSFPDPLPACEPAS